LRALADSRSSIFILKLTFVFVRPIPVSPGYDLKFEQSLDAANALELLPGPFQQRFRNISEFAPVLVRELFQLPT